MVDGPSIFVDGQDVEGPFLLSVDGPGGPDRFGVWRLYSLDGLSLFPQSLAPVVSRRVNHSANSFELFNGFAGQGPPPPTFLKHIDNQVGIPVAVAAFADGGPQVSYIANVPFLGLQAIAFDDIEASFETPQVDGRRSGVFRSVATVRDFVLAVGQDSGQGFVSSLSAELGTQIDLQSISTTAAVSVLGLPQWPVTTGEPGEQDFEVHDLVVVPCGQQSLCTFRLGADGRFTSELLPEGPGRIDLALGLASGIAQSAVDQLIYTAHPTTGLAIVDLSRPGGKTEEGVDERLLWSGNSESFGAFDVSHWRDGEGNPIVGVASGSNGINIYQTGVACGGDCGTCRVCDPSSGACDASAAFDSDCCDRALFYENYRRSLDFSNPRKLFGYAIHCVGDAICDSLGPLDSGFDDPDWMLCINRELFEMFQARAANAECWDRAERRCDFLAGQTIIGQDVKWNICFLNMVGCHDLHDMKAALVTCGCGTGDDWDRVSSIVGGCADSEPAVALASAGVVRAISLSRGVSGCE